MRRGREEGSEGERYVEDEEREEGGERERDTYRREREKEEG